MQIRRAWKYRLYPSKGQQKKLNSCLYICKNIWNSLLAHTKGYYEETKKFPDKKQLHILTKNSEVYSQVAQNVADRLIKCLQLMVRNKKAGCKAGFPRFKSMERMKSFTYPQSGFKLDSENKTLELSKIGAMNIKKHREMQGDIKTLTIKKSPSGKWYAIFTTEFEIDAKQKCDDNMVGIDLGIEHFAYLSNGEIVENPRHLKHAEEKLKKVQRELSGKKKGSMNRKKAKRKLAIVHEKLANKRRDFLHKTSKKLTETYSFIALEKLDVKSMSKQENHLAKSIHDCSWTEFISMISYKAAEAGSKVVLVNPVNTTKQCSNCNLIKKKSLADRWHECVCGLSISKLLRQLGCTSHRSDSSIHRDHNAARNILNRATGGTPESKACGDETTTHYKHNEQVSSMKQEANGFSRW